MNVLREIFNGIKKERYDEPAPHLRGYGCRRRSGFVIWEWWNKQRAWPDYDREFNSLQRFLIDGGHLGIARNDVARSVIGRQFNTDDAVLCHCQPHYCLIFRNVNLPITHQ